MNSTLVEFNWYPQAIASCSLLKVFGIWLLIDMLLGILLNSFTIYLYIKYNELRTPTNSFVFSISICDLIACLIELPLPMIANFSCKWIFGKMGCYFEAFIAFFIGASSVFILCSISIERYYAIVKPIDYRCFSNKKQIIIVLVCYLFGLFWAVIPLTGWSSYELEGVLTSCSVKWQDKSWSIRSYNILMFIFVFFIPLIVMFYCNLSIYLAIRNINEHKYWRDNDSDKEKQLQVEMKFAKLAILIICTFLISWLSYAIVGLISISGESHLISPLMATIPSLFAKTTVVWNPIVYMTLNKNFYLKLPFKQKNIKNYDTIKLKKYFY